MTNAPSETGEATRLPGMAIADGFMVFFAMWTLVNQIAFFGNLSFSVGWSLAWLLGAGVAVRCLYASRSDRRIRTEANSWILVGSIVGVLLAVCLHRPDADDEFYLGLAVMALDEPGRAISALPVWSRFPAGYGVSSYDSLRASLTWFTGLPLLASYYLVWPALLAALTVVFHAQLLSQFGVRCIGISLVVFFVLMIGWGDAHRTPPNFGFVRLFQGKGGLISVAIPAAIHYWLAFLASNRTKHLLLLACAIVCAIGFSPSGVPTGTLLIAIFAVSTFICHRRSPEGRLSATKLSAIALYPFGLGLLIRFKPGMLSPLTIVAQGTPGDAMPLGNMQSLVGQLSQSHFQTIEAILGSGFRAALALFCILFLPCFLNAANRRLPISLYASSCACLLIFPLSSGLFGAIAYTTFSWRWLYVVPFVVATVVVIDSLLSAIRTNKHKWLLAGAGAILYLSVSPRWVVSNLNHTELRVPGFKVADPRGIQLRPYEQSAAIDGLRLISPATGKRY